MYVSIQHKIAEIFLYKRWRQNIIFFQIEIIKNVFVRSFCFIWIPMVRVYGHYEYFNYFSAGTVFIRQNLTSVDVRFWRINTAPSLKGSSTNIPRHTSYARIIYIPNKSDTARGKSLTVQVICFVIILPLYPWQGCVLIFIFSDILTSWA